MEFIVSVLFPILVGLCYLGLHRNEDTRVAFNPICGRGYDVKTITFQMYFNELNVVNVRTRTIPAASYHLEVPAGYYVIDWPRVTYA